MASTKTAAQKIGPLDDVAPLLAVALSALKGKEEQREKVKPGRYRIATTIVITTEISVAADHPAKQVNKLEPWTLIALLLDKLPGVKIDEVIAEAAALKQIKKKEEEMEQRVVLMQERAQHVLDTVKPIAADAVEAIKDTTVEMRKGAVKLEKAVVKVVSFESMPALL